MEKRMNKKTKLIIVASALLLTAVLAVIGGSVAAKYIKEQRLPGSIKLEAELAESIEVFEHKADRQDDGTYVLLEGTANETTEGIDDYMLMPGVDVPKDPTVRVTGYTGIPAYVFIEVTVPEDEVEVFEEYVAYSVTDNWSELDSTAYPGVWYTTLGADDAGNVEIPVLAEVVDGCQLQISDTLPRGTTASLSFTAYIGQIIGEATPAQVYGELTA